MNCFRCGHPAEHHPAQDTPVRDAAGGCHSPTPASACGCKVRRADIEAGINRAPTWRDIVL